MGHRICCTRDSADSEVDEEHAHSRELERTGFSGGELVVLCCEIHARIARNTLFKRAIDVAKDDIF